MWRSCEVCEGVVRCVKELRGVWGSCEVCGGVVRCVGEL